MLDTDYDAAGQLAIGNRQSEIELAATMDEADAIFIFIAHIHLAIAPALICRFEIYCHTLRPELFMQLVYVFNNQENNAAWNSVA